MLTGQKSEYGTNPLENRAYNTRPNSWLTKDAEMPDPTKSDRPKKLKAVVRSDSQRGIGRKQPTEITKDGTRPADPPKNTARDPRKENTTPAPIDTILEDDAKAPGRDSTKSSGTEKLSSKNPVAQGTTTSGSVEPQEAPKSQAGFRFGKDMWAPRRTDSTSSISSNRTNRPAKEIPK
jgi:hypothetical protein